MRRHATKYLYLIFLIALISVTLTNLGIAQPANNKMTYLLSLDETGWRSCRVSITIQNNHQKHLIFTLPNTLPGSGRSIDAIRRVLNFKIEGEQNKRLSFEQLTPTRWLVATQKHSILRVTYDIQIQETETRIHKLDQRGVLINPGLVFMFIENYRHLPADVRFILPENWKIATSLRPTSYLNEFIAENYDALIDAPILLGDFQDFYFRHQDKTINVVINQFKNQPVDQFLGTLRKIVRTQSQIFSSLPFESYIFLCEFQPATKSPRVAGFGNACVLQVPVATITQELKNFAPMVAREFFQLWNGKRIRPETVRIGEETRLPQTNLLWFSEGFTHYYGDLTMIRGKIWSEVEFLHQIGRRIARVLENPYNEKMTVSAASLAEREVENKLLTDFYESRGFLIALLLDLQIREATRNKCSLDNVFQLMNWWFGKTEKPYSAQDIIRSLNAVSQREFTLFFERYVNGTKALKMDESLRYVGLNLQTSRKIAADWGVFPKLNSKNQVITLAKNSMLDQAGLKKGDQILAIDTVQVKNPKAFFQTALTQKENSTIKLHIQRNREHVSLAVKTGQKYQYRCIVANLPNPNQTQLQNRQLWLNTQRF